MKQVGLSETSYIYPTRRLWEKSDMALDDLQGQELYEALMKMKPAGLTEGDWAAKAGLNRGFFSDLKYKGIRPRIDTVRKLTKFAGDGSPKVPAVAPDAPAVYHADAGETVEIIQLDLAFSMGPGTHIDDYIEEALVRFDLSYIRSFTRTETSRLRLAKGVGDSMFPTLTSNDQVWIDTTQTMLNQQDRIWAISLHGAAAIKRLRTIGPNRILVISDNKNVEPQEVDADDLIIGGRVIRFTRDL
jgi:hypothetical protein